MPLPKLRNRDRKSYRRLVASNSSSSLDVNANPSEGMLADSKASMLTCNKHKKKTPQKNAGKKEDLGFIRLPEEFSTPSSSKSAPSTSVLSKSVPAKVKDNYMAFVLANKSPKNTLRNRSKSLSSSVKSPSKNVKKGRTKTLLKDTASASVDCERSLSVLQNPSNSLHSLCRDVSCSPGIKRQSSGDVSSSRGSVGPSPRDAWSSPRITRLSSRDVSISQGRVGPTSRDASSSSRILPSSRRDVPTSSNLGSSFSSSGRLRTSSRNKRHLSEELTNFLDSPQSARRRSSDISALTGLSLDGDQAKL